MMTEQTTVSPNGKGASHEDVKNVSLDIPGILERFKLPGFDLDGFLESRKLDIDSVTKGTSTKNARVAVPDRGAAACGQTILQNRMFG